MTGHLDAQPFAGGGYDGDYDCGGPSQPGARRGLRLEEHLESVGDLEVVGDRFDEVHVAVQRERAAVQGGLELSIVRGIDRHGPVPCGCDRAVCVPIDCGVEYSTALLRSVRVDIGPAAGNPYPQGCPSSVVNPIHVITAAPSGCASLCGQGGMELIVRCHPI